MSATLNRRRRPAPAGFQVRRQGRNPSRPARRTNLLRDAQAVIERENPWGHHRPPLPGKKRRARSLQPFLSKLRPRPRRGEGTYAIHDLRPQPFASTGRGPPLSGFRDCPDDRARSARAHDPGSRTTGALNAPPLRPRAAWRKWRAGRGGHRTSITTMERE